MTTSIESMPAPKTPSLWQLLFGMIDRPVATFEAISARRGRWMWVLPLLVVIVTFAVVTVVQIPYTLEMARQQAEVQLAELPAEQAEAARATMEFTLSLPFMLATSLGAGIIILILGVLVQAAFLYFGALIIGGNDVSFGAVFTMGTWARLPMAIGYLVQAGFIYFIQGAIMYPGLAFLVSTGSVLEDAKNPLMPLLASIDIFWLWNLLLVVLGLAVVARIGRGKSLLLVLLYAVLALGITVLPSLLFGAGVGG